MPPDSGIAFVVVTHVDPHAISYLPELLSRVTHMPVREAIDGQVLAENTVVVMPRQISGPRAWDHARPRRRRDPE